MTGKRDRGAQEVSDVVARAAAKHGMTPEEYFLASFDPSSPLSKEEPSVKPRPMTRSEKIFIVAPLVLCGIAYVVLARLE